MLNHKVTGKLAHCTFLGCSHVKTVRERHFTHQRSFPLRVVQECPAANVQPLTERSLPAINQTGSPETTYDAIPFKEIPLSRPLLFAPRGFAATILDALSVFTSVPVWTAFAS